MSKCFIDYNNHTAAIIDNGLQGADRKHSGQPWVAPLATIADEHLLDQRGNPSGVMLYNAKKLLDEIKLGDSRARDSSGESGCREDSRTQNKGGASRTQNEGGDSRSQSEVGESRIQNEDGS